MSTNTDNPIAARTATLDELIHNIIPNFISPVPSKDTVRSWLDAARVPRFKSNPTAKRGGGKAYYHVAAVEKLFRSRMTCKRTIAA